MEARCVPLKSLTPQTSAWYAKVRLISIGSSKREPHVHVLLFADKEKTIMQANVYARDFKYLERRVKPLETYYIGSSRVSPISNKWYQFGTIPFQFTLNMTSYIQQVEKALAYRLSDYIEVTPVWDIDSYPEKEDSLFNVICSFIHMLPTREVGTQGTTVREFVVLNQECRPMLITFWDSYTSPDLTELITVIHTHPVVLLVGVTLGSFHGTCLQKLSSFLLNECAITHASQLSNPYLGLPLEVGKCEACGTSEPGQCEGHFGYIELPIPLYHPDHVGELKRLLSLLCLKSLKIKIRRRKV